MQYPINNSYPTTIIHLTNNIDPDYVYYTGNCIATQSDAADRRDAADAIAKHNQQQVAQNNNNAQQNYTKNAQEHANTAQVNPAALPSSTPATKNTNDTTTTTAAPITTTNVTVDDSSNNANNNVLVHEDPNSNRTSDQILASASTATNELQQKGANVVSDISNAANNTTADANNRLDQSSVFNSSNASASTLGETAAQIRSDAQNVGNDVGSRIQSELNNTSNQLNTASSSNSTSVGSGISFSAAAGVAAVTGAATAAVESVTGLYKNQNATTSTSNINDSTVGSTSSGTTNPDYTTTGPSSSTYEDASGTGVDSTNTGNTAQTTSEGVDYSGQPDNKSSTSGGLTGRAAAGVSAVSGAVASAGAYAASSVNSVKQAIGLSPNANPAPGDSTQYRDIQANDSAATDDNANPTYGDGSASGIDNTNTGNTQGESDAQDHTVPAGNDNHKELEAAAAAAVTGSAVAGSVDNKSGVRAKIYIVYYSLYTHMRTLAHEVAKGVQSYGADVSVYQIPETLPGEVLTKMHAPPKSIDPIISPAQLAEADGIIFGMPTRFGQPAAQVKGLLDSTGQLWAKGALLGKTASTFFGTATPGGGQETTAFTFVTQLAHHGMIFVPIGYSNPALFSDELHGGSPYGAGTYAGGDGSRQPSTLELGVAEHQGKHFAQITTELKIGRQAIANRK